ncbi:class I SAM-dependent methyltransferase [candidate division KSB1 bacterium]|nr:class I SAM-dependent methyltransferase [bacterium]NUM65678.1 class I SAM-dependent methyltransferase [candidate division KSB1 bacterium]
MDTYVRPGMKVLDVGCGDGQHLEYLATSLPKCDLFGTEISQIRVDRVNKKGFACAKVDGPRLPFHDRSFDAIVFFEVIEHIPEADVDLLLREITRVLKRNGVVVGSTPNYPIKRYYDFSHRILSLLRRIPAFGGSDAKPPQSASETYPNESTTSLPKEARRRQPWLIHKIDRLFADDPTHQFFCSFNRIYRLGKSHFQDVELFTTFEATAKTVAISSPTKFFSHKIVFVFKSCN